MNKKIFTASLLLLTIVFPATINANQTSKSVTLYGTKIFKPEYLVIRLGLDTLSKKQPQYEKAAEKIKNFYSLKGYTLVKPFLVIENRNELKIFIDEGRIDRIVFYNLNSIDTLRLRYKFKLKHNIYNRIHIKEQLTSLKKRYDFKSITAKLQKVKDFDKSFIQLNRDFSIPFVGDARIPFLEKYQPQYNLQIHINRYSSEERRGIRYGIRTSYSKGFRPYIEYEYPSLAAKGDKLETGISAGIFYGFDLKFTALPHWTYMEFSSTYHFKPTIKNYFTPAVQGYAYRSWASREDLGLDQYEYLILRGTIAPGITLLKKLKIYATGGAERVHIYNSEINSDASFVIDINEQIDYWSFMGFYIKLNLLPFSIFRTIDREFSLAYNYFMNDSDYHSLEFKGKAGYEFKNFDFYSLQFDASRLWPSPPFYHEIPVSDDTFKGFMGKSYHTHRIIRVSNEYMISLYRDYIYGGIFFDFTGFEGSGYDLTGNQYGIAAGPGGHFVFLDQFEFNMYFGKDYLFSRKESQYNIQFSFHKKW